MTAERVDTPLTIALNDVAVIWGRRGVERIVVRSVEEIAYGMLRTQRSYSTRQFSINVKEVVGRKLVRPILILRQQGEAPPVTVSAREAELRCNPSDNTLSILLKRGRVEVGDQVSLEFPGTEERRVPLSDATRKSFDPSNPSR